MSKQRKRTSNEIRFEIEYFNSKRKRAGFLIERIIRKLDGLKEITPSNRIKLLQAKKVHDDISNKIRELNDEINEVKVRESYEENQKKEKGLGSK